MYYKQQNLTKLATMVEEKSRLRRQNRIYKGRNGGVYPVRNHVISFENVVKQFDDEPVLKMSALKLKKENFIRY